MSLCKNAVAFALACRGFVIVIVLVTLLILTTALNGALYLQSIDGTCVELQCRMMKIEQGSYGVDFSLGGGGTLIEGVNMSIGESVDAIGVLQAATSSSGNRNATRCTEECCNALENGISEGNPLFGQCTGCYCVAPKRCEGECCNGTEVFPSDPGANIVCGDCKLSDDYAFGTGVTLGDLPAYCS